MKFNLTIALLLLKCFIVFGQNKTTTVYLFPGQGSDYRIFNDINFPENTVCVHINYPIPDKKETMQSYALRLCKQIDTTLPFAFVGVSFGGMIVTELSDILQPTHAIIISSAKSKFEIPVRYRFMKFLPVYKLVPPFLYKIGSKVLQPIVEPDRKNKKEIFKAMLNAKNSKFLKRATALIVNWDRTTNSQVIYHIHGTKDHTLPAKNINASLYFINGSHMMALTEAKVISRLIFEHLNR